eukprot:661420-Pelagomonas_calceolata.AAC.1
MWIWRVTGCTRLQNLAARSIAIFHSTSSGKEKKKLRRQRKLSLHQLRNERRIGSKGRESPLPEDKRGVSVGQ